MSTSDRAGFTTRALRVPPGGSGGAGIDPVSVPIFASSTFAFERAEPLAEMIEAGKDAGYVYSRWHNPTRAALEETIADLEGAERAVSFASGMAAISAVLATLLRPGDHVVCAPDLYGGSFSVFRKLLPEWGVRVTFARSHAPHDLFEAVDDATKILYCETIGNPTCSVADLELLGRECRSRGVRLVVDNTFASPYLCTPLEAGAHVVLHSTTKYIGGHHDLTGGIVAGDRETMTAVRETSVDLGGTPSPFDAWLTLRGLATLALRMDRHCANARAVAEMLEAHPRVARVWYPGLPSHPDHETARRVLRGFSGMIAVELEGGLEAGRRFVEGTRVAKMAASLGGVHTLVIHPATVTHTQLSREERLAGGITDGLVRISCGIEDTADLVSDLRRALEDA